MRIETLHAARSVSDPSPHSKIRLQSSGCPCPRWSREGRAAQKIRQLETASHINDWLASPGLLKIKKAQKAPISFNPTSKNAITSISAAIAIKASASISSLDHRAARCLPPSVPSARKCLGLFQCLLARQDLRRQTSRRDVVEIEEPGLPAVREPDFEAASLGHSVISIMRMQPPAIRTDSSPG